MDMQQSYHKRPLVIDLFAGLGGWSKGFLESGYEAVGFDIERHQYGDKRYPGQLVLQDIRTLHGSQFRNAAVIVASPPCQEFSYMAMPWKRGKQIAAALRGELLPAEKYGQPMPVPFPDGYTGSRTVAELTALFDTCFRLQREASAAAGRYIPLVVENVKGAQPWVGPAKAHFGSFYLWGDVESVGGRITIGGKFGSETLRSFSRRNGQKTGGNWFAPRVLADGSMEKIGRGKHLPKPDPIKNNGESWFGVAHNTESGVGQNPVTAMERLSALQARRDESGAMKGQFNSKSPARKAASAMIAEIPHELARWVAESFNRSAGPPYPA